MERAWRPPSQDTSNSSRSRASSPQGPVEGHPNIKFATSIIDYIFRMLGVEYLKRYDLAHVPPDEVAADMQDPTDVGAVQQYAPEPSSLPPPPSAKAAAAPEKVHSGSVLDQQLGEMMGDAPMCDTCWHITVRNGACYKCLNRSAFVRYVYGS